MYADLILNTQSRAISNLFTYRIPKGFESVIKIGDRVIVPFGNAQRYVDALVYSFSDTCEFEHPKEIIDILPKKYSFTKAQMFNMDAIRKRYACTHQYAFHCVLPTVQQVMIHEKYLIKHSSLSTVCEEGREFSKKELLKMFGKKKFDESVKNGQFIRQFDYSLRSDVKFTEFAICNFDEIDLEKMGIRKNSKKQIRILQHLYDTKCQNLTDLMSATSSSRSDIRRLVEKELILIRKEIAQISSAKYEIKAKYIMDLPLSAEQSYILNQYNTIKSHCEVFRALIQGVTGSGKTRLYMEIAKRAIEKNQQVLILLPEISLTPQLIGAFRENVSDRISVIHNKVGDSEKSTHFENIKENKIDIVIGARSAMFAPFSNLGLIIVDEAHENTYMSETVPRFDARELVFDMSLYFKTDLIYGSATPPLQLLNLTQSYLKKYEMKSRIGTSRLPDIQIVDMKNALLHDLKLHVSEDLIRAMSEAFKREEQVILFYNRRGYANFLQCHVCGHIEKCINCDISLKVHKKGSRSSCHYCGYSKAIQNCSSCGSKYLQENFFGVGIEKYLEFFEKKFPNIKFNQIDSESVNTPSKLIEQLEEFRQGNIHCMIGTQILAKGLDFPNVTLIGILDADQMINMPDYMANERAFALMMQVAGRAGRHEKPGKVIIQTLSPELELFRFLEHHDFDGFAEAELKFRKLLFYPPYSKMYLIGINSEREEIVKRDVMNLYRALNSLFQKWQLKTILFKPGTFYYTKLKNKFIYYIIMKGPKEEYTNIVNLLYNVISIDKYHLINKESGVFLDFNPIFL